MSIDCTAIFWRHSKVKRYEKDLGSNVTTTCRQTSACLVGRLPAASNRPFTHQRCDLGFISLLLLPDEKLALTQGHGAQKVKLLGITYYPQLSEMLKPRASGAERTADSPELTFCGPQGSSSHQLP